MGKISSKRTPGDGKSGNCRSDWWRRVFILLRRASSEAVAGTRVERSPWACSVEASGISRLGCAEVLSSIMNEERRRLGGRRADEGDIRKGD